MKKIYKYRIIECNEEQSENISFYFIDYDLSRETVYTHIDLYVYYNSFNSDKALISSRCISEFFTLGKIIQSYTFNVENEFTLVW